jgi:Tfp pilus assembly protein PilN
MYDEADDQTTLDDATPPEESGNKTFLIVAALLGGVVLLSVVCLAVYGFYFLPRQTAARNASQATLEAQNLQVSQALTEKARSVMLSQVAEASPTLQPTETPVFKQATPTVALADPQTAHIHAPGQNAQHRLH